MRKVLAAIFVLVAVALLAPAPASACRTCDVPSFWDPNCSHSGCTYCAACDICCGGDPAAGGNCAEYCGGPAFKSAQSSLSRIFFQGNGQPDQTPGFFRQSASTQCSPQQP
jgi:hypothetical protein